MSNYRALQLPASTSEQRLQERLAALEEKARQIDRQSGKLIHVDQISGQSATYATNATYATATTVNDGAGNNMQLAYTPPVDAYCEVNGCIGIVQAITAAYNYVYGGVLIDPVTVDGVDYTISLGVQNQAGPSQYSNRTIARTVELAAGITYTFSLVLGPSNAGTWTYFRDAARLWLNIKAWVK